MSNIDLGNYLSIPEAAKILSISPATVHYHVVRRGIGARIAGRWVLTKDEVEGLKERALPGRPVKQW